MCFWYVMWYLPKQENALEPYKAFPKKTKQKAFLANPNYMRKPNLESMFIS